MGGSTCRVCIKWCKNTNNSSVLPPTTLWPTYTVCKRAKHQIHAKLAQGQAHFAIPREGVVANDLALIISIIRDCVWIIVPLEGSLIKLQGITVIRSILVAIHYPLHRVLQKSLSTGYGNSFLIWAGIPHLASRIAITTIKGKSGCNWSTRSIRDPALVQGKTWHFWNVPHFECKKLSQNALCSNCCSPVAATKET